MRLALVSRHLPEPEGSAAGRILLATAEGLLAEGHDLTVWSWRPEPPEADLPAWCTWLPLPAEAAWRIRARALVRPRRDAARAAWTLPADAVAVAEEPASHAAVAGLPVAVTVFHYATALDVRGTPGRRWRPPDVQHARAERRAARHSRLVLAYSPRVADHLSRGALTPAPVPAGLRLPEAPLPAVDRPIAVLVADWAWPPNCAALRTLLGAWPAVREAVPGAELRLAGRGEPRVGTLSGVRVLGPVARSGDVLGEAAVLAFPCPPTSGPKVKVLEALGAGLPVATTPAGVEGLRIPTDAASVSSPADFAAALIRLLRDPAGRARMATVARAAVADAHAPRAAARARVDALERALQT